MADPSSEKKSTTRQYHPYQGHLDIPIQSLYNLPTSPEYLFHEEAAAQRRSWGENLQYYTGCGYLSGAVMGAAKGSLEGLSAAEPGDTLKLRLNRVLNSGGQTGRRFGNSLGVVGLIFAGLESGMMQLRGTDDLLNSVLAGLGTGALYRAAAGPRSAAIAGAIGGLAAGAAVAGKQAVKRYVPI
ncbi:mitochondrial import inner membrane translocase subunit TIM23-2 isoform X2 [Diospyros lotus]|nr:mitochondrial import inner membrane translocase subunit TIM23-2 isoform X2 [Diospyros lotus]